jgi:nitroreductase
MNVRDALLQRKSVRAYLDRPVGRSVIERVLDAARHAPSWANTQPWQLAVVSGKAKAALQQRLERTFRDGEPGRMDYRYYPVRWQPPHLQRRSACGLQLYAALGIKRGDKERRQEQWAANYRAFDAPVMLFCFVDATMEAGSWIDCGMFLQSLMLAALEEGLATCPQAALAEYPDIVRQALGYPDDVRLLCGMALGYKDRDHPVNSYRTPRQDVHTFTCFFEQGLI